VAALTLGLLAGPLIPRPALAAFTTCTSDPVLTLSNGAAIDVRAVVSDVASDVTSIVYTVHAPAGTRLVSVLNTGSVLGLVEHVNFYADNAAKTYDSYTTVSTGRSGVTVKASTTVVSVLDVTLGLSSTSGLNGQSLHIHFTTLL
jgi:hypothetical protein